mmetsp:Transcript_61887/g.182804  ORF Transcript_61887/g.182804 Transcript_61887/m.182804 type:complete len:206 (-) Transcript_61887:5214-5831(-)
MLSSARKFDKVTRWSSDRRLMSSRGPETNMRRESMRSTKRSPRKASADVCEGEGRRAGGGEVTEEDLRTMGIAPLRAPSLSTAMHCRSWTVSILNPILAMPSSASCPASPRTVRMGLQPLRRVSLYCFSAECCCLRPFLGVASSPPSAALGSDPKRSMICSTQFNRSSLTETWSPRAMTVSKGLRNFRWNSKTPNSSLWRNWMLS